jgi:ABC-type glycerol-3-phosphate transport system substrate-binding protein
VIRQNQIYGFPLSMDTMALLYNKNLLDKSGIAVPPTNWTDFLAAVEKTTRLDRDGNIIQSGVALGTGNNIEHAPDILAFLMIQKGITVTDSGIATFARGLQNRDAINHPTLEALRFYSDFARPTKKVYSWNDKQETALQNFARGKSVFYLGFAYDLARIHGLSPQMTIGVVPVPQLTPESPVNVANYWVESVVKKSTHQNEAWDFIRFISLPDNLKIYSDATHIPSPLRVHVQAATENPETAPFAASLLTATNWYSGRNYDAAQRAMRDMANNYLQPYGDRQDPQKRDAGIVIQAAAVVQQTL